MDGPRRLAGPTFVIVPSERPGGPQSSLLGLSPGTPHTASGVPSSHGSSWSTVLHGSRPRGHVLRPPVFPKPTFCPPSLPYPCPLSVPLSSLRYSLVSLLYPNPCPPSLPLSSLPLPYPPYPTSVCPPSLPHVLLESTPCPPYSVPSTRRSFRFLSKRPQTCLRPSSHSCGDPRTTTPSSLEM